MKQATTFGELRVGEKFYFSLGLESGLWDADKNKPGRYLHRKTGSSAYLCIGYYGRDFHDAAEMRAMRAEHHFWDDKQFDDFVEKAKVNRSGYVGSKDAKVWRA